MPAPATIGAAGWFTARRGGSPAGEALLELDSATRGALALGGNRYRLTANVAKKTFEGASSSKLSLQIASRNLVRGSLAGAPIELSRAVLRPIPATELALSDPGPTGGLKAHLAAVPDYLTLPVDPSTFWTAFGPVLYRGRLDGSARVLGIASDPGPTECLPFVRRTLVGDSGQRVQGFLAKLGLTRSYVLVNAFAVALRPSKASAARKLIVDGSPLTTWRNRLLDLLLAAGALDAIVAFGENAQLAYDRWAAVTPAAARIPVVKVAHPAAVDRDSSGDDPALKVWAGAVKKLRKLVTPDDPALATGRTYGAFFTETDYARVPRWDLPSAAPRYVGDDSWGRAAVPRHNNCCERPRPDDAVSLVLTPPPGQGEPLRYFYRDGKLDHAERPGGGTVATDASGIPL